MKIAKISIFAGIGLMVAGCQYTPAEPFVSGYNGDSVNIRIDDPFYLGETDDEVEAIKNLAEETCARGGKKAEYASSHRNIQGSAQNEHLYLCL